MEGYDSDVPVSLRPTVDPGSLQSGGFSTMLNAALSYAHNKPRTQFAANATSTLRHYAEIGETRSTGHSAGVGLSVRLPSRTTLQLNQAAAYSPTYLSGLFPTGEVVEPGNPGTTAPDFAVSDFESYAYTTSTSLRRDFSRRSNVSLSGQFQYTDRLRETTEWRDVSAYFVRGQYGRGLGRSLALTSQAQYRSGEFGYGGDGKTTEIRVDMGLTYTRRLSSSRQAVLRFNAGASGADAPLAGQSTVGLTRQYTGVGEAGLEYQFGRGWQAKANYRRGLEYIVDLPQPVFADSVGASVDGLVTRRMDISMAAGYSSGESLTNRDSLQFDTYTGSLRLRYALSRQVAPYVEYLYYYYNFRGSTQLRAGIPSGLERNGVRVGLTLWMPALRR